MGSDLDKLMKKLKSDKPTEEIVKEEVTETPKEEVAETPAEEPTGEPTEEEEEKVEETPAEEKKIEESEPIPANEDVEPSIEHEVAVLQNVGVFRRELLLTLKELVEVHKANTQTLIDIKKKLVGGENAKK